MDSQPQKGRFKYFCLGLLAALAVMLLAGAGDIVGANNFGPPNYGRYQISSWSSDFGEKGGGFGLFMADTATGEAKLVYSRVFGEVGNGEVKKDELGKPFGSIK